MKLAESLRHFKPHTYLIRFLQYVVERHGSTLLPQYLGMYRLTVDGVQYYYVVMRNVFSSHLTIHRFVNSHINFISIVVAVA